MKYSLNGVTTVGTQPILHQENPNYKGYLYHKNYLLKHIGMKITLCQIGDSRGNNLARRIVENYHSYVPTWDSVGRRIDWIIMLDEEIVGVIGIGSATYPPCKDVLARLGVSKEEYKAIFNNIANNWRFCLIKSVPNLGTMVLRKVREIAPIAWYEKYGDELKYLVTFVGGGNNGAIYRADNWEMIGHTSGLPEHSSVSMKWDDGESLKKKFVKPTGEDKKMIFFKTLKKVKYKHQPTLFDFI